MLCTTTKQNKHTTTYITTMPTSPSRTALSPTWRYATNALSLLSVFCFSGIIFGWAPLELLLLQEGQYSELCSVEDDDTNNNDTATLPNSIDSPTCPAQMNRLNAMFTLAQFWLSFASLPVGFLLDMAPKPLHFATAGMLQVAGLLLLAISDSSSTSSDWFIVGYSLLALGGCMTMLGAFPASFLLPTYQAGILASISCLFDASSIVFFVFFKAFEEWGMTRQSLFGVWTIVAVVVYTALVFCWAQLERMDWKTVIEQEDEEQQQQQQQSNDTKNASKNETTTTNQQSPPQQQSHTTRVQELGLHEWNVRHQLQTYEYGLAVLFASSQMLRCNFFIMTVDDFLKSIGDTNASYARLFSWILPCGIVFVPLIEWTVTSCGVLQTLHITNAIGMTFGVLLWIPSLAPVQVMNFALFTAFRAYLYSTLNTFIAVTFGVTTMGRIIGFVFTTAAVVSLIQYPLSVWTNTQQQGNFLPVNIGLVGLCFLPVCAAVWYDRACRSVGPQQQQQQRGGESSFFLNNNDSYGSIGGGSNDNGEPPKRKSLLEGNTTYVLSSPGSPSLAAIRQSRKEQSR